MSDQKEVESIFAIKQYISKSEQNTGRHKASILIHANKKDHGLGIRIIFASVEGNLGQVIIEDLHTLYDSCSNTFTTKDCCFSFVAGTLCINAEGPIWGKISVNIT